MATAPMAGRAVTGVDGAREGVVGAPEPSGTGGGSVTAVPPPRTLEAETGAGSTFVVEDAGTKPGWDPAGTPSPNSVLQAAPGWMSGSDVWVG